jgi:hypothetical protein
MTWKYRLNGEWVNPQGEWEISYQRNVGQIFFRRIWSGEIYFVGDDYDTLMSMSDCDVLEFIVYCGDEEWWTGQFKFPYDFDIDEDSCFAKGEPEVVDEYSCIMEKYEKEYWITPTGASTATVLQDCAGGALATLPNVYRLMLPGAVTNAWVNWLVRINLQCTLDIRSSFFMQDNFPNGDNYAAAYGLNNYITGAYNRLQHVHVLQNSSLKNQVGWGGTGTGCAAPYLTTFKEWETMLRVVFNAYWYIDENGDFRIEHRRFFDPAFPQSSFVTAPDLNTIISSNGKSFAYRRNKYTYDTGYLYDQETWQWQYYYGTEGTIAHGTDFQGMPVYYFNPATEQKSDCVPGTFKEKLHSSERFWTDIYWAYQLIAAGTMSTISCDGWLLLDLDEGAPGNPVNCETGIFSGIAPPAGVLNGHLSLANLHYNYHRHDRIFPTGYMNTGGVTPSTVFLTWQPIKLQEPIEIKLCCDMIANFHPLNLWRTGMGSGRVKSLTWKQNSVEVELLY